MLMHVNVYAQNVQTYDNSDAGNCADRYVVILSAAGMPRHYIKAIAMTLDVENVDVPERESFWTLDGAIKWAKSKGYTEILNTQEEFWEGLNWFINESRKRGYS